MCRTVDLKALCKVELKAMLNGTVEIISGRERRRRLGVEEKLRIVAETQEAGAYHQIAAMPQRQRATILKGTTAFVERLTFQSAVD
jgi:hypothetical protein